MTKRELPKPTGAELAVLRVLWHRGPSTVREVLEHVGDERSVGYTTVLKITPGRARIAIRRTFRCSIERSMWRLP